MRPLQQPQSCLAGLTLGHCKGKPLHIKTLGALFMLSEQMRKQQAQPLHIKAQWQQLYHL